ncbi:MAG: hypothetical protein Ct9H300mP11_09430 [Chloroflexota bacterium]|nr:MAG: hypothetical protein Ct9H300mP11_09430 [Chloroflexota bacterium]
MNIRASTGMTPIRCHGRSPKINAAAPQVQPLRPLVMASRAVQTASENITRY